MKLLKLTKYFWVVYFLMSRDKACPYVSHLESNPCKINERTTNKVKERKTLKTQVVRGKNTQAM